MPQTATQPSTPVTPAPSKDFNIKPPQPPQGAPAAAPIPTPAPLSTTTAPTTGTLPSTATTGTAVRPHDDSLASSFASLSGNSGIIGLIIMAVLAIVFFFIRGAIRSHLVSRRASSSSASSAAWALFCFLFFGSATVVFGALGQLWGVLPFIIPLGVLVSVSLILFIVLYSSAVKGRR